jgi:hypothetical protein
MKNFLFDICYGIYFDKYAMALKFFHLIQTHKLVFFHSTYYMGSFNDLFFILKLIDNKKLIDD